MLSDMKIVLNEYGTYDVLIQYTRPDVEFGSEFNAINSMKNNSQKILNFIKDSSKKVKISSVKIMVSGALVTTMALSSFVSIFAAGDRYNMGYLYSGTDQQHIEYVNRTNGLLDTVSPSYFDIEEDGSLKLNYLSETFIESMHSQDMKVVPFLSNHWNRTAGINALEDVEKLSTQVADYVYEYDLDGVNVDIENVTHEQREQYTELVRLLREKIPEHKEVSVAVAANPYDWQTGWHGSYDYTGLAQYADHLFLMTYDEHYEGSEAGPVASIGFVEDSIKYALTKTTADKIVVGLPLYGRIWSLDSDRIVGKGIKIDTINEILKTREAVITYDEESQSVKAEFEIKEDDSSYVVGGDITLNPGKYVVWYENDDSYRAKLDLVSKYDLKGTGSWSLGQEDPSVWDTYQDWINGDDADTPDTDTPDTNTPDTSESTDDYIIYEIKSGDTLWGIAERYLGSGILYKEIKELNGLQSNLIYPGQKIRIPYNKNNGNIEYVVKKGDSLWRISERYLGTGTRYNEIKELNDLVSDTIYPDQVLKLPID